MLAVVVVVAGAGGAFAVSRSVGSGADEVVVQLDARAPKGDDERDAVDAVARYLAHGRRGDTSGACALVVGGARREQRCDTARPRATLLPSARAPVRTLRVDGAVDAGDGRAIVYVSQAPPPGGSGFSVVHLVGGDGLWRVREVEAGVALG